MNTTQLFSMMVLLLFGISGTSTVPDSQVSGQVELFNGKDLEGWTGDLRYWRVEEGMIAGQFTEIPANQFLWHEQQVSDFRLILRVRIVGGHGNSGVQFRSEALPNGLVRGPQADIGDGYWGKLYEEYGRNWLWREDECDKHHVHKDGWNEYEILAIDSHIRTAINGNLCVDLDDPYITRSGILALQLHKSWGPAEIHFKDFRLELNPRSKELKTLQ